MKTNVIQSGVITHEHICLSNILESHRLKLDYLITQSYIPTIAQKLWLRSSRMPVANIAPLPQQKENFKAETLERVMKLIETLRFHFELYR